MHEVVIELSTLPGRSGDIPAERVDRSPRGQPCAETQHSLLIELRQRVGVVVNELVSNQGYFSTSCSAAASTASPDQSRACLEHSRRTRRIDSVDGSASERSRESTWSASAAGSTRSRILEGRTTPHVVLHAQHRHVSPILGSNPAAARSRTCRADSGRSQMCAVSPGIC